MVTRPVKPLTASLSVTYAKAYLTNAYNPGSGGDLVPAGQKLPGTPKWQYAAGAFFVQPVGAYIARVGLTHRYIGPSSPDLQNAQREMGNYFVTGLRGGLKMGDIDFELFGDNLFGEYAMTNEDYEAEEPFTTGYPLRPRQFGLQLTWAPQ